MIPLGWLQRGLKQDVKKIKNVFGRTKNPASTLLYWRGLSLTFQRFPCSHTSALRFPVFKVPGLLVSRYLCLRLEISCVPSGKLVSSFLITSSASWDFQSEQNLIGPRSFQASSASWDFQCQIVRGFLVLEQSFSASRFPVLRVRAWIPRSQTLTLHMDSYSCLFSPTIRLLTSSLQAISLYDSPWGGDHFSLRRDLRFLRDCQRLRLPELFR